MGRNHAVLTARKDLGLTQTELGRALGVSLRTIARYENGGTVPEQTLLALHQLLERKKRKPK